MDRPGWKGAIVGISALAVVATPVAVFHAFGETGLQAASVAMSGLLSLALIVLYFQQYTVLDRQTRLMEQDFEASLVYQGPVTVEEDTVYVKLRNSGRGAVKFMYLKTEIVSDTGDLDIEPGFRQLSPVGEDGSKSLPSYSDLEEFKASARLGFGDEEERDRPFRFITSRLALEGIETCTIRLSIQVVDEAAREGRISQEFDIAEQELVIEGVQEREIGDGEGGTKTIEFPPATTFEDAIKPEAPQDIYPRDMPLFDFD